VRRLVRHSADSIAHVGERCWRSGGIPSG
jgi:hypothetical protein